jgi:hypothetical protein
LLILEKPIYGSVSKSGQPNPVKTVQTLLATKKKDTSNKEPRAKRTDSEVSNDSNTSHIEFFHNTSDNIF